jgi:hypothetical protein
MRYCATSNSPLPVSRKIERECHRLEPPADGIGSVPCTVVVDDEVRVFALSTRSIANRSTRSSSAPPDDDKQRIAMYAPDPSTDLFT